MAILSDKPDFLKAILNIPHPPSFCSELVTWLDRRCKPSLEFFQVLWVAAAQLSQDSIRSGVPAEQAVNDDASKAHFLSGLRGSVQGVVVAIKTGAPGVSRLLTMFFAHRRLAGIDGPSQQ